MPHEGAAGAHREDLCCTSTSHILSPIASAAELTSLSPFSLLQTAQLPFLAEFLSVPGQSSFPRTTYLPEALPHPLRTRLCLDQGTTPAESTSSHPASIAADPLLRRFFLLSLRHQK